MTNILFETVAHHICSACDLGAEEVVSLLETPPSPELGDVSLPCFTFSKRQRKAPYEIAKELCEKLLDENNASRDFFSDIKAVGGYLNIFICREQYNKIFFEAYENGILWDDIRNKNKGKRALLEHTSINPNASPHIGRARNALIGDAIARLLRYVGYDTTVHYFVNDIGKQIALLVYYIKDLTNIKFDDLLNIYVEANEFLKNHSEIESEVFDILHRMENGDEEIFAKFSKIVDICIKGQTGIFNELGVYYDVFDYESQYILHRRTDDILNKLKNTEKLFEDEDGRLVLDLSEFKINVENPYLPLTRKDKTSLYPLRDICYSIDKSLSKADKNIVVLGEDQKIYGRQINAALQLLGYKGAEIVNYSFVLLPQGKMSTRAGQVVLLEDLMRETVEYAKTRIIEHGGKDDSGVLARQLAYGAIKYSILKCSSDKNVVFDRESALKFEGDTSVYIQYTYARIQSLLQGFDLKDGDYNFLNHTLEWELIKKLSSFTQVLCEVSSNYNFSSLCTYLFELCKLFSKWYAECSIRNTEDNLRRARGYLASIIAQNIKAGLNILGIDAPDKI